MIHCLFIGGPSHSKTTWLKIGARIDVIDGTGQRHSYQGENYLSNGRLYRILRHPSTTLLQEAEAPALIVRHSLKAVA